MKKLLILLVLIAAGYFAYQYFIVGNLNEEQKQVQALADEFSVVKQQLLQAERAAGVSGVDTTGNAGEAVQTAGAIKDRLLQLKEKLSDKKAITMAEDLAKELQSFLEKNGG